LFAPFLSEASAKVRQIFFPRKLFHDYFSKKANFFLFLYIIRCFSLHSGWKIAFLVSFSHSFARLKELAVNGRIAMGLMSFFR